MQIDGIPYPIWLIVCGGVIVLVLAYLLFRPRPKDDDNSAVLAQFSETINALNQNQNQLAGALRAMSDQQNSALQNLANSLNTRLEEVQLKMGETLQGNAQKTARSLGELHTRLETIDKAQSNIERLSDEVLSLQDLLSNKQARGSFGEIQLNEIVSKALAPDAYNFQHTLSNNKRADCIHSSAQSTWPTVHRQ